MFVNLTPSLDEPQGKKRPEAPKAIRYKIVMTQYLDKEFVQTW